MLSKLSELFRLKFCIPDKSLLVVDVFAVIQVIVNLQTGTSLIFYFISSVMTFCVKDGVPLIL